MGCHDRDSLTKDPVKADGFRGTMPDKVPEDMAVHNVWPIESMIGFVEEAWNSIYGDKYAPSVTLLYDKKANNPKPYKANLLLPVMEGGIEHVETDWHLHAQEAFQQLIEKLVILHREKADKAATRAKETASVYRHLDSIYAAINNRPR